MNTDSGKNQNRSDCLTETEHQSFNTPTGELCFGFTKTPQG